MADEYDAFYDDDLPWEEVGKLLDQHVHPRNLGQTASTSRSAVVASLPVGKQMERGSTSAQFSIKSGKYQPGRSTSYQPAKHSRSSPDRKDCASPPLKKMKGYAAQVLKEAEEDYMCPICCDLIVACHSVNPCGHSACESCLSKWVANKDYPTCFACRGPAAGSFIPSLRVDSIVETYINALANNGDSDWQKFGVKRKDWEDRKLAWMKEKTLQKEKEEHKKASRERVHPHFRRDRYARAITPNPYVQAVSDSEGDDDEADDSADGEIVFVSARTTVPPARVQFRDFLARLPVQDNPHDLDYVPNTPIPTPQTPLWGPNSYQAEAGPSRRVTRSNR